MTMSAVSVWLTSAPVAVSVTARLTVYVPGWLAVNVGLSDAGLSSVVPAGADQFSVSAKKGDRLGRSPLLPAVLPAALNVTGLFGEPAYGPLACASTTLKSKLTSAR